MNAKVFAAKTRRKSDLRLKPVTLGSRVGP